MKNESGGTCRIEPYRIEYLNDIARIEREAFPDPWSEHALAQSSEQQSVSILCALSDDKVVGYIILYRVLDEADIARIAVSPSHRRRGIGRALLEYTLEHAASDGISRITLDVRESNLSARALYEGSGAKLDGYRRRFYSSPQEDAALYSFELRTN